MRFFLDDVPLQDADGRWDVLSTSNIAPPLTARVANLTLPGLDGVLSTPSTLEAPQISLAMAIKGRDHDDMMLNYTSLAALFRNSKKLGRNSGTEFVDTDVEFVSGSEPTFLNVSNRVHVTFLLRINGVYWRGQEGDFKQTNLVNPFTVQTLDNTTAPVSDCKILLKGPGKPKVECGDSWVYLDYTLGGSDYALIDCADFTARTGSGVTFAGGGTVRTGSLQTSGGPYCLVLQPEIQATDPRQTKVTVKVTGASEVTIRARGAYIL